MKFLSVDDEVARGSGSDSEAENNQFEGVDNTEEGGPHNGDSDLVAGDMLSATPLSLLPSGAVPQKFSDLNLPERTMKAIEDMKFENMTEIQQKRYTTFTGRPRCSVSCEDGIRQDTSFLNTSCENAELAAVQTPKWHWCDSCISHKRTRSPNIRRCSRIHGTSFANLWNCYWRSELPNRSRENCKRCQPSHCNTR